MFETLVDLLYDYCRDNNLEHDSADDILYCGVDKDGNELTPEVKRWLSDYGKAWDAIT